MNITNEFDDITYVTTDKLKLIDKREIEAILKENFGENCTYNRKENTIYVCDNQLIDHPAFIQILSKFKVYIQPSLFPEDFKQKKKKK